MAASVPASRAHAWFLQARVAEGLGDEAMAARGMGWAERLDRDDPGLARQLVDHARRQGDHQAMLDHALDAVDAAPEQAACELPWAHRAAADAWLELGHSGDARRHLDLLEGGGCRHVGGEVAWAHRTGNASAASQALVQWAPVGAVERLDAAGWALALERSDLALTWLAPLVGHPSWPEAAPLLADVGATHPEAVRALLQAVAPAAGPPWTDVLASLEAL